MCGTHSFFPRRLFPFAVSCVASCHPLAEHRPSTCRGPLGMATKPNALLAAALAEHNANMNKMMTGAVESLMKHKDELVGAYGDQKVRASPKKKAPVPPALHAVPPALGRV